jgi:two-component system response regulator DesR
MFQILVVEDNANYRKIVCELLRSHFPSINVLEASDGDEALPQVTSLVPDMILLDIKLPKVSGLELAKQIKALHSHIVVVILSSYDLPEYRSAAFRNGADCFIAKGSPSCTEEVFARIEGIMAFKSNIA